MTLSKTIQLFIGILLGLYSLILWLTDYSGIGIPEYIGETSYQTYSVAMLVIMAIVLIIFQRILIKRYPTLSIWKLILWSVVVCVASQAIYQLFRQLWILRFEDNNKAGDYFISVGSILFLSLFISMAIAFELRKGNRILKTVALLAVAGLFYLMKEYLPNITW